MTTTPRAARFFIRRVERPATPPDAGTDLPFASTDDGFGNMDFRKPAGPAPVAPEPAPQPPSADPGDADDAALAAIAAEGLTGRQLRRARLVAQSRGIEPRSDLDAVLQLRRVGIDPFSGTPDLEAGADPSPEVHTMSADRQVVRLPGDQVQLPQRARPIAVPTPEKRAEVNQAAEIMRMQQDIARRRRRRLALLFARMLAFVLLPTFLAGWYFYQVATPMYSIRAEFVIQQAGPSGGGGALSGLFSGTGFATSQDSMAVQGYLQSREAMLRLEEDQGFKAHFQDAKIDDMQRLPPDATMEDVYGIYKKYVKISYDQTEGIIRMEVVAPDPDMATAWAKQLVAYAEEQVDHLTQRLRADQMRDSQARYDDAQMKLTEAQTNLLELQEKFKVISSETEVGLITTQIAALDQQLTQERLSLAQMEANESPNQARMEPIKRRIATLENEVALLRAKMTEGSANETSLADIQGQLLVAQAELHTRQMMLTQSLQSMETAAVEANRQVRYLSLSVSPVPTDEPAYPRAFENTMVTMLILLGIYLMISMTVAILREQVTA